MRAVKKPLVGRLAEAVASTQTNQDPPAELQGAVAKIDRGGEHLDTLYRELRVWAESDPCTFSSDPGGASKEHRIYVNFNPQPNPRRWGLLLGDAVHNLRSALDHVIYALAMKVTGEDPPPNWWRLEFPILSEVGYWEGVDHKLGPLTDSMRTLVRSCQPFETSADDPQRDLLWILRELDNADKHRVITPVGVVPAAFRGYVRTITGGQMTVTFLPAALRDGATVMTISGDAISEVESEHEAALLIALDTGLSTPIELSELMDPIFDRVVMVVREFERFF